MHLTSLHEELHDTKQRSMQRVRQQTTAWLNANLPHPTHHVTLTFNKAPVRAFMNQFNKSLTMNSPEMLEQYSEALKRFGRALNRALFNNAAHRHNKSILMIPVFEGLQSDKTPHVHVSIQVPREKLIAFQDKADAAWKAATPFAGRTHTEIVHDSYRANYYNSKQSVFTDRQSIDYASVLLPKS